MKRLLRTLLNVVTVLSLLLCVTTVVLWVRSYRVGEMWTRGHEELGTDTWRRWMWQFASSKGSLAYMRHSTDMRGLGHWDPPTLAEQRILLRNPENRDPRRYQAWPKPTDRATFGLPTIWGFGFKFSRGTMPPQSTGSSWFGSFTAPYWALTVACALPLLGRIWYTRRLRSKGHDLLVQPCPGCGYDLRATPDRCPECGQCRAPKQVGSSC